MNQKTASAVGILALIAFSSTANPQEIEIENPTFVEAAVFFIAGKEAVKNEGQTVMPGTAVIVSEKAITIAGEKHDFEQGGDDHPCRILEKYYASPPYMIRMYDFALLPGPRSARPQGSSAAIFTLPADAVCWSKREFTDESTQQMRGIPGTSGCAAQIVVSGTHFYRRMEALQYIRRNFCAGQPEPPITVRPY
jgi:hypothetical protein